MEAVLVVNCDATCIRFAAYDGTSPGELSMIGKGHVLLSGDDIEFFVQSAVSSHPEIVRSRLADGAFDHDKALSRILRWVDRHCGLRIIAVGHRATHVNRQYPASVLITDSIADDLEAATPSDHAYFLKAMRFLRERLPSTLQVACFDSASRGSPLLLVQADTRFDEPIADLRAARADMEKAIALDTLRCTERSQATAVIHAFPAPAPEAQREGGSSVALALTA